MTVLLAVLVFCSAIAIDFAEARYVQAAVRQNGHDAGMFSVAMYVFSVLGFLAIVDGSRWFMIPECIGLYVGTRLAFRRAARRLQSPQTVAPCLHGSCPSD